MAIDASIISGLRQPEFESPTNALAKLLQVQTLKQQNDIGANKLDEFERGRQGEHVFSGLIAKSLKPAEISQGLAAAGFGKQAMAYMGDQADLEKKQADAGKIKADAEKTAQESASHQFEMAGQLAAAWASSPNVTHQTIRSGLAAAVHSKIISPEIYQAKIAELDGVPGDAPSLNQWAVGTLKQVMKAKESMGFIAPDANTIANNQTSTANNAATNATSRANNASTVAASRDNAAATRAVASATRDAAQIQRDQGTEMKLADDYRNQSKLFKETSDAYRQIQATLDKATTSPAATLAGATKFMKLLDPGSVVRESELGMALAATGAFDRAANYVESLKYGKVLTQQQVKDFKGITAQIYKAAQVGQQQIDASYTKQAKTYNLRPEVIMQDLGQNAPAGGNDVFSAADAILKGGK
jgi:hypothetical protein